MSSSASSSTLSERQRDAHCTCAFCILRFSLPRSLERRISYTAHVLNKAQHLERRPLSTSMRSTTGEYLRSVFCPRELEILKEILERYEHPWTTTPRNWMNITESWRRAEFVSPEEDARIDAKIESPNQESMEDESDIEDAAWKTMCMEDDVHASIKASYQRMMRPLVENEVDADVPDEHEVDEVDEDVHRITKRSNEHLPEPQPEKLCRTDNSERRPIGYWCNKFFSRPVIRLV